MVKNTARLVAVKRFLNTEICDERANITNPNSSLGVFIGVIEGFSLKTAASVRLYDPIFKEM